MKQKYTKNGSAAVLSLTTVMILLVVSLGVTGLSIGTVRRADRDTNAMLCYQAAQAGLELQVARAKRSFRANKGVYVTSTNSLDSDISALTPGVSVTTTVDPQTDKTKAWITSTARFRGQTRSVRAQVDVRHYTIWDNVIFAGGSDGSAAITGNTSIHGSVHILGEGEPYSDLNNNGVWDAGEKFTDKNGNGVWDPGEPFVDSNKDKVCNTAEPFNDLNNDGAYAAPLTAASISGSLGGASSVGNNYQGMSSELRALVADPPMVGGRETLNANFRVRHGQVSITGSGQIGEASGKTYKGPMDGVFVNDGFAGKGASAVFSDNGTNNAYDMENLNLAFPLISGLGAAEYEDASGTIWTTQQQYLDAKSMTVPVTAITSTTLPFSYGPDINGNFISYAPGILKKDPGTLVVNGIVAFASDLVIGDTGTIAYSGRGTLYCKGNVSINVDLLPAAGLEFPTTTTLGIIAQQNMRLSTGASQLKMAGAFYAQGTIFSSKQNEIAGTFVGSNYDMGSQVPSIFQVPSLVDHMPPAMPGDDNGYFVKVLTWRERNVKPGS